MWGACRGDDAFGVTFTYVTDHRHSFGRDKSRLFLVGDRSSLFVRVSTCIEQAEQIMAKGGKGGKARGKQPRGRAKARAKAHQSPRSLGLGKNFYNSSGPFDGSMRASPTSLATFSHANAVAGTPYISFRGFNQTSPRSDLPRNPNFKLRHQAITFVSAGTNTPVERGTVEHVAVEVTTALDDNDEDEEDEDDGEALDDDEELDTIQTNIVMDTDTDIANGTANLDINAPKDLFVVDTDGDPTLAELRSQKQLISVRKPSPARSDSSAEEVLFCGRGKPSQSQSGFPQLPPQFPESSASSGARPTFTELRARPESSDGHAKGWAARPSWFDQEEQQASSTWQAAPSYPYWRKNKPRSELDLSSTQKATILDKALARTAQVTLSSPPRDAEDTIPSLQEEVRSFQRRKQKAKAAKKAALNEESDSTEDAIDGLSKGRRRKRGRKKDNRRLRQITTSDDDGEAAYDDYMQNLAAQSDLPSFTPVNVLPETGPSIVFDGHLVKYDGILNSNIEMDESDTSSGDGPVGQDASEVLGDGIMDLSDLDSSELEGELEYAEQEQWEDEADLRKRRQDRMTDEHIARLFAKQQEVGIDCEELVIDDGIFDDDDFHDEQEGIGDLLDAHMGLRDLTNASIGRSRNKHGMRSPHQGNGFSFPIPRACTLADAADQYGGDGFDIMDFDRPSLRSTKKGRKSGELPPTLDAMSDEELNAEMLKSWENDRKKKHVKKAERDELRAQGLLGAAGKKSKSDLSQKYLQGLTMTQVHEEIRIFLNDEGQSSRPFPPMDKRDRKALHSIANMLNLKSKSVGSGANRFPILYKTTRTVAYEEVYFNRVISASSRSFLKNARYGGGSARKGKLPRQPKGWGDRGGYDRAAVSLRNGEVVGANAAEIGRDSIGHKLMEKMGWTKGMALGKDGEGLLVPVEQVMRSGKAGLG